MSAVCSCCHNDATHVLVTYYHEVVDDGIYYCPNHAFSEDQEMCPCCDTYGYDIYTDEGVFLPTYQSGELTTDEDGCCSEHP